MLSPISPVIHIKLHGADEECQGCQGCREQDEASHINLTKKKFGFFVMKLLEYGQSILSDSILDIPNHILLKTLPS